jgi:prophage regulatory protein
MALSETTARRSGRRLVPYPGLKERGIPFTRVHLRRLEDADKFPQHIDLGENTIAWFEDEIDDYLEQKAAARRRRNAAAKAETAA